MKYWHRSEVSWHREGDLRASADSRLPRSISWRTPLLRRHRSEGSERFVAFFSETPLRRESEFSIKSASVESPALLGETERLKAMLAVHILVLMEIVGGMVIGVMGWYWLI